MIAKKNHLAFSLLEILTVVAIVAITAAFAIPSYISYVVQTKANALWAFAEPAKLEVQSRYLRQRVDIDDITVNSGEQAFTTASSDFVKCITVQGGVVSVVGLPSSFYDKDIWISWVPSVTDEGISWSCIYSDDAAEYLTATTETCSAYNCSEYGEWGSAVAVGGTQDVWYFGNLTTAELASAFASNCRSTGTMAGCGDCYNYTDTDTTRRYMDFSTETQTYNYAGALGGAPDWSSHTSWTYDYTYTIAHQTCMEQTRTKNDCATNPPTSFSSDANCN